MATKMATILTTKFVLLLAACCCMSALANHVPQFSREINVINVKEEEPIGTHLLNAAATDADGDTIEYSLAGENIEYLRIDHRSGDITTARVIDREKFSILKFQVIASEVNQPSQKSVQDVIVHVIDKNDNAPIFTKDRYAFNVSENTLSGVVIIEVSATDKDGDELMYSITGGDEFGFFEIELYTGTIKTARTLDYEIQTQFNLQVSATDGREKDTDRHITITNVHISIIDEDDNSAVFMKNYTATIQEGMYKGEIIIKVHAEDVDKGVHSPIRYSIDKSTNIGNVFKVNKEGYVSVNGVVDREKISQYNLVLLAEEISRKPSLFQHDQGKAMLTVDVTDVDDNAPVFMEAQYIAHVKEHAIIDTAVLKVTARDADEGENAQFQYELERENGAFGVSQDGTIKVQKDLDREEKYIYQFKVLARALPTKTVYASCEVTVIIDDINDHNPIFTKRVYEASVSENKEKGALVTQVSASDFDKEENSMIRYTFIPDADGSSSNFQLDPVTGIILTKNKLDREKKSEYSILVQATDTIGRLEKRRMTTAKIKIYVRDLNDNKPIFKMVYFFKNIHYDEPINTPIIKLEATDLDANMYGRVRYRILKGNDLKRFHINELNGQIKVGDALAKYTGQFRLEVEAFDNLGSYPYLRSAVNAVVVITVDKEGENSVVLVMWAKVADVIANQRKILKDLEEMLSIGMVVDNIEKGESPDSTHFLVHGYNTATYAVVKKDSVIRYLYQTSTDEMKHFRKRWNITSWHAQKLMDEKAASGRNQKSEKWQPVIWAILGFSALVAIFGMVGIIYLIKSRRRHYDESGASLTSSRVPINATRKTQEYWNDDKFESVSQGPPDSYVHTSGFLDTACDKYELDPSNLYEQTSESHLYEQDPFIDAERTSSSCSSESRASSRFAASSVVTTICRTENNPAVRHSIPPRRQKPKCKDKRASTQCERVAGERRLSMIEDDDSNPQNVLSTKIKRPPSYEYDLDAKLPDKLPTTYYEQE